MTRPARILVNVATPLSLMLCAAAVALWVRSYWTADSAIRVDAAWSAVGATSERGGITLFRRELSGLRGGPGAWSLTRRPASPREFGVARWSVAGFRLADTEADSAAFVEIGHPPYPRDRFFRVPYWALTLLCGATTARLVRRFLRCRNERRRSAAGCCPACGYDCRATPDRCPECGTARSASPGGAGG